VRERRSRYCRLCGAYRTAGPLYANRGVEGDPDYQPSPKPDPNQDANQDASQDANPDTER